MLEGGPFKVKASIVQVFSNLTTLHSLGGLGKTQTTEPPFGPRALGSVDSQWGLRICISNKSPGGLSATVCELLQSNKLKSCSKFKPNYTVNFLTGLKAVNILIFVFLKAWSTETIFLQGRAKYPYRLVFCKMNFGNHCSTNNKA